MLGKIFIGILAVIVIVVLLGALKGCEAEMPDNLGVTDGKLLPCPDSPNCVSTQSESEAHRMEPITFSGTATEAQQKMLEAVQSMKGTKIITSKKGYLHVAFTTPVFRFVDDVEFYFDDPKGKIHFRSASRIGYSDLGVNRRRMEKVFEEYSERTRVPIKDMKNQ